MAKEKAIPITEDLTGFLIVDNTPGREVRGMRAGGPGVFLRIATDVKNESGEVVGKEVRYEFKHGAVIDPICVDNDNTTRGNMAGGE